MSTKISFFALYFLKVPTFTSFFTKKNHKEFTVETMVCPTFFAVYIFQVRER
jgi:hypothetical protein